MPPYSLFYVNALPIKPQLCDVDLTGLWRGKCSVKWKVDVPIEIDDVKLDITLFVVDDYVLTTNVLLGRTLFTQGDHNVLITPQGIRFGEKPKVMLAKVEPTKTPLTIKDINTGEISQETRANIRELVNEYRPVFAVGLNEVGKTELTEMGIMLIRDEVVAYKPYRVPEPKKDEVKKMINDMLENDIIEESTSDYASPMLLVKKPNGTDRLCVDYRKINSVTRKEVFPTPNIEELLHEAQRYKYCSSLEFTVPTIRYL